MTEQPIHSHNKGDQPLIETIGITKYFKDIGAIKSPGIDLKIMPQDVLVIIGSSGSGKSTLLRCLTRLIEPSTGQIFFEGREITGKDIDIDEVRKNVGMVFQQFNLFLHLKVGNNIRLPLNEVLKLPKINSGI